MLASAGVSPKSVRIMHYSRGNFLIGIQNQNQCGRRTHIENGCLTSHER